MNVGRLFVDMDGVIADCDLGLAQFCGLSKEKLLSYTRGTLRSPFWDKFIKEGNAEEFFSDLQMETNAPLLINWINTYASILDPCILSRPVKPPKDQECIRGKKIWLAKHHITWPAIFEIHKEKYAVTNGKPNVLIDDLDENIRRWNAAGGIGFIYHNDIADSIIKQLGDVFQIP